MKKYIRLAWEVQVRSSGADFWVSYGNFPEQEEVSTSGHEKRISSCRTDQIDDVRGAIHSLDNREQS